jgi:uncharacterized membrane protein YjjP (DUF1212 family)
MTLLLYTFAAFFIAGLFTGQLFIAAIAVFMGLLTLIAKD